MWQQQRPLTVVMSLLVLGCAAPRPPVDPGEAASTGQSRPASRMTIAFPGVELDLDHHLGQNRELLWTLVNPGLSVVDDQEGRRSTLAEQVPTLENHLWEVSPNGSMDTTWTIRDGARWHDGAPFTVTDLLFTATVGRDRDMAIFHHGAWESVADLDATGTRTLTVHWKEPYIYVNSSR